MLPTPKSARLQRALAIWCDLRGRRQIPLWSDFSPNQMPAKDLPYVAVLNVLDGGGDFTYRLVGGRLIDWTRQNFRGARITDHLHMHEVPEMLGAYSDAVTNLRPTLYEGSLKRLNRAHIRYERLALPMAAEDGSIDRILAVFEFWETAPCKMPGATMKFTNYGTGSHGFS